jgi:hypothetical protein
VRAALGILLAVASLPAPGSADEVQLAGTWYVLVHYKDAATGNPDAERWDDRVWVFERKGGRLRWTEYPIAVFRDETGRFERRSTGQYARILHHWEPSPAQRTDIADGLQVNTRGSKRKTLRGSDAAGWSSDRARGAASASTLSYSEVWSVEGLPDRPVFSRSDFLSGVQTGSMEGVTRYATISVSKGGDLLTGTFERDDSRRGVFRMMRSGAVGALEGSKSLAERQRGALETEIRRSPELRAEARSLLEAALADTGTSLSEDEFDEIWIEVARLAAQGVPEREIRARIAEMVEAGSE